MRPTPTPPTLHSPQHSVTIQQTSINSPTITHPALHWLGLSWSLSLPSPGSSWWAPCVALWWWTSLLMITVSLCVPASTDNNVRDQLGENWVEWSVQCSVPVFSVHVYTPLLHQELPGSTPHVGVPGVKYEHVRAAPLTSPHHYCASISEGKHLSRTGKLWRPEVHQYLHELAFNDSNDVFLGIKF